MGKLVSIACVVLSVCSVVCAGPRAGASAGGGARKIYEHVSGRGVKFLKLKTRVPDNKEINFFYHVPKGYDPKSKTQYRVLVIFGGKNCSGELEAEGKRLETPFGTEPVLCLRCGSCVGE